MPPRRPRKPSPPKPGAKPGAKLGILLGTLIGFSGVLAFGWQRHRTRLQDAPPAPVSDPAAASPAAGPAIPRPPRAPWTAVGSEPPRREAPVPDVDPAARPPVAPAIDQMAPQIAPHAGGPRKNAEPLWRQRAKHY